MPGPVTIMPGWNCDSTFSTLVTVSFVDEIEASPAASVFGPIKVETSLEFNFWFAQRKASTTPGNRGGGHEMRLKVWVEGLWTVLQCFRTVCKPFDIHCNDEYQRERATQANYNVEVQPKSL